MSNFTNQYFKLGYILLIVSSGGNKFDILNYFFDKYQTILPNTKKCCLLHLLIQLEEEINSPGMYKLSNFINNKIYSDNFLDFLCKCLSLDQKPTSSIHVVNHPWIKISNYVHLNNNVNKIRVSMKEVLKITREFKRHNIKGTNINNDSKLKNFLNNFDIILSNNKNIRRDEILKGIETNRSVIKDLASELGLNITELITQMQANITQDHKGIK